MEIKRGIYEGDTVPSLGGVKAGYHLGRGKGPVNHLLFVDDLKLYIYMLNRAHGWLSWLSIGLLCGRS